MNTRAAADVPVGIVANDVRAVALLPTVTVAGSTVVPTGLGNAYTALDGIVNTHTGPTVGVNVTLSPADKGAGTATFAVTVCLSTSTTSDTHVWNTSVVIAKSAVLWNPSPRVDVNVNVTLGALPTTSVYSGPAPVVAVGAAATATIPSSIWDTPIVALISGPIVPFGALRLTYTTTASFELAVTGPASTAIDDVGVGLGIA